jgi:predicted secreted Zn-dependent protease
MRRVCLYALMGLAGMVLQPDFVPEASAKPKVSTKYTYYNINGGSARNLYQQMISRGPHVSGERALAATSAETRQRGEFVSGSSCRVKNYEISINFTMRLPKVANERKMPKRLRAHWRKFYKFVRRHEERHKQIWVACARDVERRVRAIRARSCSAADREANRIFKTVAAACEKKHDAFDRAEQKRLSRNPLIVAAKRVERRKKASREVLRSSKSSASVGLKRYVGSDTR